MITSPARASPSTAAEPSTPAGSEPGRARETRPSETRFFLQNRVSFRAGPQKRQREKPGFVEKTGFHCCLSSVICHLSFFIFHPVYRLILNPCVIKRPSSLRAF